MISSNNAYSLNLSKRDTTILKGIALLLLLTHHLFYIQNGRFDDIQIYKGIFLVNMTGQISKVCVALFVFLSGYGLAAAYMDKPYFKSSEFFKKRFKKLFINYWLIWIIFVPIGVAFAGLTFEKVYGENILTKFILDLTGLLNLTGEYGYNPTWWFYSCIILLYVLYPALTAGYRTYWCRNLILLIGVALIIFPHNIYFLEPIRYYLLPFTIGMYAQRLEIKYITPPHHYRHHQELCTQKARHCYSLRFSWRVREICSCAVRGELRRTSLIVLISLLLLLMAIRFKLPYALGFDTLITILIIIAYKNIGIPPVVSRFLNLCGKHSFNIFLFHTFLYYLYIPDIIYWNRNPIIIFLTLLAFCLPTSYFINKLHGLVSIDRFKLYKERTN